MIINFDRILERNFQKISTNRFIVDSPRFWRKEYHPHFKDIFSATSFTIILNLVNDNLSFKLPKNFVDYVAEKIFIWFSPYRFVAIPKKDPTAPEAFLSDLYFTLLDILPQISFTDYPLIEDDFNIVSHKAETGKQDTSKVSTGEHEKNESLKGTTLDILTRGEMRQTSGTSTHNADDETEQNNKTVQNGFLSPQNQGVLPTTDSTRHKGVDGVNISKDSAFTTNATTGVFGESLKTKSNVTEQTQSLDDILTQDNDCRTKHDITNEMSSKQEQENTTEKNDNYIETLDFNRVGRLQDFYNLQVGRLWLEILHRLTPWILHASIATAEYNYLDCEVFE